MNIDFKQITTASLRKNITQALKQVLFMLGRRAFLAILILILVDILLGQFLFYHYVTVVELGQSQNQIVAVVFKEGVYQSVLKESKARDELFAKAISKNFQNPFK